MTLNTASALDLVTQKRQHGKVPFTVAADANVMETTLTHDMLYRMFLDYERALGDSTMPEDLQDEMLAGQSVVMRTAMTLPAKSVRDVASKMAMWRLDAPDLDLPTRAEEILLSVYDDLLRLSGEHGD